MSQLTTLLTGAGVQTPVTGQAQMESIIVIGTIATAMPLQSLQIELDGVPYININNQPALLAAYAKWTSEGNISGAIVGVALKLSTGRIKKTTNYRFFNNGATTPNVFAFSDNDVGIPFVVATKTVNSSSYEDFNSFSAIFIGTPANIASYEMTFSNGCKATLTGAEIDALFGIQFPNEAGELASVSVIDNRNQSISNVRVNVTTATTVLMVKIPDAAFQVLQGKSVGV